MSFEIEEDNQPVGDYRGICPKCGNIMTFWHDMRCSKCDQKRILYCPTCSYAAGQPVHWRLKV